MAQYLNVYIVQFAGEADATVYLVEFEGEADIIATVVQFEGEAKMKMYIAGRR